MSTLDREALRARLRTWSAVEQRIALERIVEQLPDRELEMLLAGLVHLCELRTDAGAPELTLRERVEAHVAATRRGEFAGECVARNRHGQREPWQTQAWVAATAHLFDVTFARADRGPDEDALESLRALVALVAEVEERLDERVVFEDSSPRELFCWALERAAKSVGGPRGGP